ncbi:uncharacterized protein [Atheta coriaria]|uniref:uncharacterized protein n=1 Tax=Dalotia coriaria TaxID=877792 RepID=UPI0031F3B400
MMLKVILCALCAISLRNSNVFVEAVPTEYKMNEHKIYEAELVAVSSTVIPLPIYEVHSNLKFPGRDKDNKEDKEMKPVGPLSLITSSNKKAHYQKFKSDDVSTVKKLP